MRCAKDNLNRAFVINQNPPTEVDQGAGKNCQQWKMRPRARCRSEIRRPEKDSDAQRAVERTKFWSSKATRCIFEYSKYKRFKCYRKGDRIVESFTEVVYSSTPIAPLLPPNSISSVPSMVEHGLQFQQWRSAIPVVPLESQTNQLNTSQFCTVTTPLLSM